MAIIQNSKIIQKLIDELELYPALDKVPTELADKILAVFQVNTQEVITKNPVATIVRRAEHNAAGSTTIYTTPATGKFYLTNVGISNCPRAGQATNVIEANASVDVIIGGVTVEVIQSTINHASSQYGEAGGHMTFNLQNPILIDPATIIAITNSTVGSFSVATIVGYIED